MLNKKWEYASFEWLWDSGNIRINLPNGEERKEKGSYHEVVAFQSLMGAEGWEIVSGVTGGNWIYWTLKREKGL